MAKFTATHGVHFDDLGIDFKYDAEATGSSSTRVYSVEVSAADAKKLEALPGEQLKQYGIKKAEGDDADAYPDGEPADSWTADQLKAYAKDSEIDLGSATKKADIFAAITAAKAN